MENATVKLFNTCCLEEHLKFDSNVDTKGYLPHNNDKSMIENLIVANLFRSDNLVRNNLGLLVKGLI